MKIVELKIDDSMLSGFDALALVENPAIEQDFVAFNKQQFAETFNDYPQAAIDAARRGIELNEKNNMKCATQVGKVRAQQLVNGEKLSLDTIQRMRSFLIRQKDNYELALSRKDYNACGYISYLLWGGEAALPWTEKKLRQAGIEFSNVINNEGELEIFAEVGPRGGIKESPKAPKSDTPNPEPKGEGTARGSAASSRGAEVDATTEKTLQDKADEFNEKYKDKLGYGVTVGQLKSVFQRGLGAYNTSRSPSVARAGGAKQWALARVNAFLYLVKEGRPQNAKYTTDYDLLPNKHPKSEKFSIDEDTLINLIFADILGFNEYNFASNIISFDYHDTLNTERGKELAKKLMDEGYILYVISAADSPEELYPTTRELGIPDECVYAVGSNEAKIALIKKLNIEKHYDNNEDVIAELGIVGEQFEINVNALPNYINEASSGKKRNFAAELAERQMLVGPLMTPGKLIPRKDENTGEEYQVFFSKDTIEKIAYKMMQDKLVDSVNIEHDGAQKVDDAYLVETWIVKDPEKDKSLLYGFRPVEGEWYGMYKIDNRRVWNEYVKTGKVKGFSVEGYFYNNILTKK